MLKKFWYLILVLLIEGSSLMAVELLGARLPAPFYWNALIIITIGFVIRGLIVRPRHPNIIRQHLEKINLSFLIRGLKLGSGLYLASTGTQTRINPLTTLCSKQKPMRKFLLPIKAMVLVLVLLFAVQVAKATTYYSRATANWAVNTTWSTVSFVSATNTGTFPVAGDVVFIGGGFTVTVAANAACTSVDVTGGTLAVNVSPITLIVSGNFSGTGILTGGTSARLYTVGGNWTFSGTSAASLSLTLNGTGNQTLSGVITTVTANTPALIINKTSGSVILGSNITLGATSTFTLTVGTFDPSTFLLTATTPTFTAGTLKVGGATWANNYSFAVTEPAAGTIEYDALGAQTVNNITYPGHLTLSGSGVKTLQAGTTAITGNLALSGSATATTVVNMTVGGTLTVATGCTLTVGACTFAVTGTTTINSGGSLIFSSATNPGKTFTGDVTVNGVWNEQAAITPTFAGNLTNNATTWTASSGAHTFSGTTKVISGTTATVIPSVSITGTTTNNGTLSVSTTLAGGSTLTNSATGTLNFGGTSITPTLTATAVGNTINFNGSGSQTIPAFNYYNLTISTNGTRTVTLASSGTIGVSGTFSPTAITTTYTVTGSTINFNGSSSQSISVFTFNNLTITNSSGVTLTGNATVGGTLTLTNGIVTSTATNLLSVTNTSTTAILGGSTTSFINGPVKWTLPANLASGSTYNFPVGKGTTYLPFSLVNPTTTTGIVTSQVEPFTASTGGTYDATLVSISATEYWSLVTAGNFINSSVSLTRQTAITPLDVIGGSITLTGQYTTLAGTAGTYGVTGSNAIGTNKFFVLAGKKQTISTSAISGSPFCAGAAVSVPFTITGTFISGNVFTAQLSDASGSFSSPVAIGSITQTTAGTISGTIPIGTSTGTGYRIRVVSNNPVIIGAVNVSDLTVYSAIGNNSIDFTNGLHGTVCGTAPENGNAVLTAPSGTVFINVGFASYGTPTGTCPTFTLGSCHALTSQTVSEGYLLGNNTASIPATNAVFGDPCSGTVKNLDVLATYTEPICSGNTPGTISGALPTGGNGSYVYLWESSTTSAVAGFATASGTSNAQNYTPGSLTQTTWYRRTVTSGGCSNTATAIQITVSPVIANNTVSAAQSICTGTTPAGLTGTLPTGGNGTYVYLWESSTTSAVAGFATASGTSNTQNYTPGSLTQTTWYRRTVTSGGCSNTATAIQITVNPVIANNTVSAAQSICTGTTPAGLTGTLPTGGSGSYVYLWESSTTSAVAGFGTASGTSNTQNYTPGSLTQTTWYRRTVTSGGCSNTATAIQITVNPLPAIGLTVGGTGTIYSGTSTNITVALSVIGTDYQLRNNSGNVNVGTPIAGTGGTINLPTGNLFSTTTFNVLATIASTTCSAQLTGTATVTVNAACITSQPSSVTICSGAGTSFSVTASGSPTYQWQVSTNSGGSWANITAVGAEPGYATWTTSTLTLTGTIPSNNGYQYRCVLSGGCGQTSNAATLTLQIINISYTLSASPGLVAVSGSTTLTLSGSQSNVNYQLRDGSTPLGSPVAGTGSAISFAAVNPTTSTQYNVVATTTSGGCSAQITDTKTVIVNETGIIIDLTTCNGQPGLNFFTNSDFGTTSTNNYQTPDQGLFPGVILGYPLGAYTNYTYGFVSNAIPDGNYVIANSTAGMYRTPQQVMGRDVWLFTYDRSLPLNNGTGDMYIVNASNTPGVFYTETLSNLCENTRYEFRSEIINLYDANWVPKGSDYLSYFPKDGQGNYYSILPNVDFMLDGKVALNTGNIMNDAVWNTYGFTFRTATGQTSLTLTMRNNSTGGIGNDLALDNIIMRVCGPEISLIINTTLPVCPGVPVTMTAVLIASDYVTPEYKWQKSTDNGVTWNDISGANGSTYTNANPAYGDEFRFIVAETTASLGNPNCSVASNPVSITTTAGITGTTPGSVCGTGTVTLGATANSGSTINWYANLTGGSSLGTGASYTTPTISTTTTYYVEATNAGCTSNPRTSVVATVNTPVAASISITANTGNSICSGTNVTFTATPINGGATPSYQWKLNGIVVGTNSPTYSNNTLANGDIISCIMTSSISGCITGSPATSNSITMTVGSTVAASVSISANPGNTICQGTSVTFTAVPTNGGATPNYQWKKNGTDIFGAVSNIYTTTTLVQGDAITCVMTTSLPCATGSPVTSNTITMTVNPNLPASVSIAAVPSGAICTGTSVAFTATPTNGGTTPSYQWYNGASPIGGATSSTYTSTTLTNGAAITVHMTSNATCATGSPATSNTVTMTVYPTSVGGTVVSNQTICTGTSPASLTLSGNTGAVIKWQKSTDAGFSSPTDIAVTSTTLSGATIGNLTVNTYFRAVVQSGVCSIANSASILVTVTPTVGTPTAITVSAGTEPTCQLTNGTTTTTYATTATNNTGFNWSLSNGSAGSIGATTGIMTWANSFSGSVDIRVTASGCNGPSSQVTRTVTITPTVGTPTVITISAGTEPTCQLTNGTTTTTYSTTATNNTGYNWSLSNGAAGSIGTTTGIMTWANGYSGSVDIRVTANGCNGPSSQVTRTVTITPIVGTPTAITVSAGTEPTCQLTNGTTTTTYSTTATNNTGFNWSLSNGSAGSIDAATGIMTWANGFSGSVNIQVTANGCNGPSAQVTRPVTITTLPIATFSYTGTPYCSNAANPSPTFSGGGVAGTFSSTAGLVFVSTSTGEINLAASTAGTYTITNTIAAASGCSQVTATSTITITTFPTATIYYAGSPFSMSDSPQSVTLTGTTGGTYTALPAGLTIDLNTGVITPGTSSAGTYTVTYTVAASGGCGVVTATTSVTILNIINVSGSNSADGTYGSLTNALGAFVTINAYDQTGKTIIITIARSSIAETGANSLNAGAWTTLTLYPTATGITISGNFAGPLINLNGTDNVTIDGRVNATGSVKDLIITNTNTSAIAGTSTIRFINSTENNTVKYCTVKGSETIATSGVIFFSTATAGNGNDGNIIDNNNITSDAAGRPINAIYSAGSVSFENSGNTISNNNIYDFLKNGTASNGINLAGNNITWAITGNSLYETASFIPTASVAYTIINASVTTSTDITISGNFIGGSSASAGGTAWTKTNASNNVFTAINLNVGTTPASNVQNNIIRNFAWSNSLNAAWTGINIVAGNVNIGTGTGNTIGAATGTGSITVTGSTTGAIVYGINTSSAGTIDCQNNNIGSITADNAAANATNFYGINKTAAGTTTISNNTIGSAATANSINANSASSANVQSVYGIYSAGIGTVTINNNTVANLTNSTNNTTTVTAGLINGITSTNGTNTISNNIIHDLTIANANTSVTNTASVCGIALTGATLKTVSGNTIYNLSNIYASFAGDVIGLYFTGITGANVVSGNFIHSLSVTGASSTTGEVYGIKIAAGATTYYNNIINLGGNTATTIYGIYETGATNNNNNLYFNTVYIGGSLSSGITNKSYSLYSAVITNTRNFRNNILVNARSTTGGASLHYAAYFAYAVTTKLTALDYNDYYAPGTGGVLGYYNGLDDNTLPLITGFDANSLAIDPGFANAGGTTATDYIPSSGYLAGTKISTILKDYLLVDRANTPTMGAFEGTLTLYVDVYKSGVLQSRYPRLKEAFDRINDGTHTDALEIRINANITENASAVLYQSGYTGTGGTSNYTSVNIFPTVTGITETGNLAAPLIDLNGADNVTIDGRVNATGSVKDLIITNTSISALAGTSTIRFINSAENNIVKYCTVKGSETIATSGVIFFSTATAGNGNDGNIIDNNNITNAADINRPINAIYSLGSTGYENSGNTISNNNIYDFLKHGTISNGINLAGFNITWTIAGNSLYETASFIPTVSVAYTAINASAITSTDITISGNFIGGSSASAGGTAWTKTNAFSNAFTAINLNGGTTPASNVQNNTVQNFAWSNSLNAAWTGINIVTGDVNVGTGTGNTIGAATGIGSITVTGSTTGAIVYGINIASTGTIDCQNNNIGSITADNAAANATNFYGINKTAVAGTTTISNNTVGSTTTASSINASSASTGAAQSVFGIYSAGTGLVTINNNTIVNLINSTTNATTGTKGLINGITSTSASGTNIISDNTIHDLTIANANTATTYQASVCGISLTGATLRTVSGNTIYNLSNTYPSFAGNIYGLFFTGGAGANIVSDNIINGLSASGATAAAANIIGLYFTAGTGSNTVSGNFIYSLSAVSSITAVLYGIRIAAGASTYYNNIISLGGDTKTTIYGIYETGAAGNDNNLYFNTVYIGGSLVSGATNKSYSLYSAVTTNTRNFRNNILVNARSTISGASLHYAAYFAYAASTNLTLDYNDYYAPGTGGVLGYYNTVNVPTIPLITGLDANSVAVDPVFANAGGTAATDYKPSSNILAGITISGITTDYSGTTRSSIPTMGAFEGVIIFNVDVYKLGVLQSSYTMLRTAFNKINDGTYTGALEVRIHANTIEGASAVLYQSGYTGTGGTSNYSSVNIYPTVIGITVTGNLSTPLIDLNGADNVTFDGRVNATGSVKDMIITNTNTSATAGTSTIRFINSAENDTIKYCTVKGSETIATSGVIFFSTATAGNGNDGNIIYNNNITSDAAGRPINAIYSLGSSGYENSGNAISNNNIYDFLKNGTASNGINLAGNNTTWTIAGNSLYETASFIPTASVAYTIINASAITSTDITVSGNFIGGSSASAGGTAWTKTNAFSNAFTAINLNVGTTPASNIQNNTIRNFSWSNSLNAAWTGINIVAGNVNIGTGTGNTIGASTGTGSITVTSSTTGANVYGINIASAGTVDCQNNNIGSITADNAAANATNFYGINKTAVVGITTISNNTIGSTTTANSINASSASTGAPQSVFGIYSAGTDPITINNNTIANLINSTTNSTAATAGLINGITSTNGTDTISDNTIRDLTIANANNKATNTASVCGISLTGATLKTISGNTIYNLSNTYASFAGDVIGLYFTGGTGANVVSGNFIHSLSVTGASSTTGEVYGIKIATDATTYFNNIISLGGNTKTTIYGIAETGAQVHNNDLYFNTVYIGGSLGSGTNKSFSLYSAVTANTRIFSNNILVNARSTTGGTSLHYTAYFNNAASPNLILDYNDYYAPGTGGVLGYYNGADVTTLPLIAGQDANSLNTDPSFINAGSTVATDYKINIHLLGITITGITTDFGGAVRGEPPCMGAWEKILRKWKGLISTDFATPTNWTDGTVPLTGENILFDNNPDRDCYLDGDRIIGNLTINQPDDKMVLNGYRLSVNGSLSLTNGGQIDARSTNSTIAFTGSIAQLINSGAFTDNNVYNFTLNNSSGVSLNGDLDVNGVLDLSNGALTLGAVTLTIAENSPVRTSGTLNASNAGATLAFTNSSAITLPASIFTGAVNNMTINGAGGVTASSDFTVNGILHLQSANPSSSKGSLDMGSSSILTMGSSATTTGQGDVTGIVKRTSFVAVTSYTFGNQYTTIDFQAGGTLPTDISVKIAIGSAPSWKTDAILRTYDIVHTGGSDTLILNLHYLDSELNANPEADLLFWDYLSGIPQTDAHDKTNSSTIDNWAGISNLNISYFPTTFGNHIWTLSKEIYAMFEGIRGWRMISSPTATNYGDLLNGFITQGATGSSYPGKQPNCLWFDETDTLTTNMSWRTMGNLTNSITHGRGHFFYVFDSVSGAYSDTLPRKMSAGGNANFTSGTFSFTGGNQPVTFTHRKGGQSQVPGDTIFYETNLSDEGWNLLGNPTYSTLNWDASSGWTKTNLDNTIYIWDPGANSRNGEYKVWNGTSGALHNGLIAPFQAFWVHANTASPGLSFTNSVLTSGGTFYGGGIIVKSQQADSDPFAINISLNAGGLESTAIISFMADAKVGPDDLDAYRLEPPSDSWLELFTLSSPSHIMPLVINNLPVDKPDFLDLPLFVGGQQHGQSLGGRYSLHWELPPDWPADWAISLNDHLNERAISMRSNQNYDFDLPSNKSSVVTTDSIGFPMLPANIINPVSKKSMLKSSTQLPPFSIIIQKGVYGDDPMYIAPQAELLQNYPNPFNYFTTLRFSLPLSAYVTLKIYDIHGVLIDVVADRHFEAGIHNLPWNSGNVKPGIYMVQMHADDVVKTKKLVITTQ